MKSDNLVRVRKAKLLTMMGKVSERRQEAYIEQKQKIEDLLDELSQNYPRSDVFKECLRRVLKTLFYDRPSQRVIDFLLMAQTKDPKLFKLAFDDYYAKEILGSDSRRKKLSVSRFWGYYRSVKSPKQVEKALTSEDMGLW